MENNGKTPEDQADKSPLNGVVPPVSSRWKPGQSGNPSGRKTAGATIREHINSLSNAGLSEDELRKIARDKSEAWTRRSAAERILRTLEAGDLLDFESVLKGEETLREAKERGVNTEVIKRIKQKSKVVKVADGEFEEIIEREIELHDRAGQDFDRIMDRTDGKPKQSIEIDANVNTRERQQAAELIRNDPDAARHALDLDRRLRNASDVSSSGN